MKKVAVCNGRMEEIMKTTNFRTSAMVQLALFTAIIILLAFTPLGYIKTLGVEITLIVIPVTVGAIILGPKAGAILGAIFGITSFLQCFGLSAFGTMLFGISPIGTFVICMVPRMLMGWLTGLIFINLRKVNRDLSFAVSNLIGPLLNTVFFILVLLLLFYNTEYIQGIAKTLGAKNIFTFVVLFVGLNGLIEMGVSFIIGTAVSKTIDMVENKTAIRTK
jgi:uncharacterized membrane protein